jgi:predicted amidohydrolase
VHVLPREAQYFAAGDRLVLAQTTLGRIGLLICWDAAFPEAARAYAIRGADILVVLAAWEKPYGGQWELSVRARALDNGIFVAGCNRSGTEGETTFAGTSLISDPLGNIVAQVAGDAPGIASAILQPDDMVRARLEFSTQIRELRPATYGAVEVVGE